MNLGQVLLIIFALWLLATIQLTINSSISRAALVSIDSEARIDAISIGHAMLDEVTSKSFDTATVSKVVHFLSELTPQNNFGPEGTENAVPSYDREPYKSEIMFNDVDDYHQYTRIDSSTHLGAFSVRANVIYVQDSDQDAYSSTPTWYKKITVVVKHPNLADSVMIKSLSVYRQYF